MRYFYAVQFSEVLAFGHFWTFDFGAEELGLGGPRNPGARFPKEPGVNLLRDKPPVLLYVQVRTPFRQSLIGEK